jgi:hypothetical protein
MIFLCLGVAERIQKMNPNIKLILLGTPFYVQARGFKKRCRPSWQTNSALVYEPKCVRGGGGSCGASANEYSCKQGAQINFGDLFHI